MKSGLPHTGGVKHKWTEPAPKYGPTGDFGRCEAANCDAKARVICSECEAHVCFGHADHATHDDAAN
jgi:hypothetical protein